MNTIAICKDVACYVSTEDPQRLIVKLSIICLLAFLTLNTYSQQADSERLEEMVTYLASDELKGRGFGSVDGERAANYIIEKFQESGIQQLRPEGYFHSFDYRNGILNIGGNNVVGIVRSEDPELSNEYIILGAHYDHLGWKLVDGETVVYNGADDNASGVASIIEIGRILNENKEWLGRSVIIVAFDGEESGLIGSHAFVDELILGEEAVLGKESIVVMINLDMVGMYEAHGGVDLLGWDLLKDSDQLLKDVLKDAPVDVIKRTNTIPGRTDTTPFGKIGIPTIHLFTNTESPYHKPEDDSELLDYEGMAKIADFAAATASKMSTKSNIQKSKNFEKASQEGNIKRFNPGVMLNYGVSNFNYKGEYYKAKGVFSYGAGIMLETRISDWLAFQPEVLYEWSGSKVEDGVLRTHALTVPVSFLLTTTDEEGYGVRTFYQFGGYYSYNFDGKDPNGALDFTTNFSDTDYGYIIGLGFEIENFRIGYFLQRSLLDFSINADGLDIRKNAFYMKVGWAF